MMRGLFLLRLVALASAISLISVAAFSQDDDEEAPSHLVTLDRVTVERLGIVTKKVEVAEFRGETNGFGLVMAFDALAQTDADLATAEAAVQTSEAALARSRALFAQNVSVSRQTVETAERQAAADKAQLSLAQRKGEVTWGQGAPWRTAGELNKLVMRLSSGDTALVRVTFSSGTVGGATPALLRVQRVEGGIDADNASSWTAKTIWRAPADPTVPGLSFFAIVDHARGLLPGERLLVSVPGDRAQQGVIIPSSAMIIAEGTCWYYSKEVQPLIIPLAPLTNYLRMMLDMKQPTKEGYFVPGGNPEQEVVVEGAGLLLAKETGVKDDED